MHEITIRESGKAEMAFAAGTEPPWHFRDTQPAEVPAGASIADWVTAAGMDWTIVPSPVLYEAGDEFHAVHDRYVLHRSDTYADLGIVSGDYNVLHPAECLEFFDDLVKSVGLSINTAGTLFGGRRFWALASVGEDVVFDHADAIKGFVLLSSSADGVRATEARYTSVRVVCNNTLRMSDRLDSAAQIRVTHRSEWDAAKVKEQMGLAPKTFEAFMAGLRSLASRPVDDKLAQIEVRKLLGKEDAEVNQEGKTFARVMERFRGLATGNDLEGVDGTAWGLLNALTETVDHSTVSHSDSHRFANALMGGGERLKARFRNQLLELTA